jgi:hypothetical protein
LFFDLVLFLYVLGGMLLPLLLLLLLLFIGIRCIDGSSDSATMDASRNGDKLFIIIG